MFRSATAPKAKLQDLHGGGGSHLNDTSDVLKPLDSSRNCSEGAVLAVVVVTVTLDGSRCLQGRPPSKEAPSVSRS